MAMGNPFGKATKKMKKKVMKKRASTHKVNNAEKMVSPTKKIGPSVKTKHYC